MDADQVPEPDDREHLGHELLQRANREAATRRRRLFGAEYLPGEDQVLRQPLTDATRRALRAAEAGVDADALIARAEEIIAVLSGM